MSEPANPGRDAAQDGSEAAYRQLYAYVEDLRTVIAERERAMAAAQDAQRARDEFLSQATIALTEPITTILGFAEIALDAARDPGQRDALARVLKAAQRLDHQVRMLLELARTGV